MTFMTGFMTLMTLRVHKRQQALAGWHKSNFSFSYFLVFSSKFFPFFHSYLHTTYSLVYFFPLSKVRWRAPVGASAHPMTYSMVYFFPQKHLWGQR